MKRTKLLFAIFGAALGLSPVMTSAQAQQESVADAARKAQANKKAAVKPAVVYSNDNLDTIKGSVSVVGQDPTPSPAAADKGKVVTPPDKTKTDAAGDAAKTDAAAPADKAAPALDEAGWRAKFTEARRVLADDAHELDILQREYNLKTQQYYTDPNVALKEQYTNDDLNKTKKAIDDKTVVVAKDKQAISDLEDALRKAGGDPGWAREQ
jgi:hypothetical protein